MLEDALGVASLFFFRLEKAESCRLDKMFHLEDFLEEFSSFIVDDVE